MNAILASVAEHNVVGGRVEGGSLPHVFGRQQRRAVLVEVPEHTAPCSTVHHPASFEFDRL